MRIRTAYIEITNQCNFDCATCYNRSGQNLETLELSPTQVRGMVARLSEEFGCQRILLAGGEPCLHSQFQEILELRETFPAIELGVVTNGSIQDECLIERYLQDEKVSIQVSLDGSCEEVNARTRGVGNFKPAQDFIRRLTATGRKPLVKMVISRLNYDDVEAFFRMVVSLGAVPEYAFINCNGNAVEEWNSKSISAQEKLKVLRLLDRLNQELGVEAFLPVCTSGCPLSEADAEYSVAIKVDGTIQPCQLLYHTKYAIGNMMWDTEDTLKDGAERIMQLVIQREHTDYGCSRCLLQSGYKKGCMALADYRDGDPLGSDGDCEFRKIQFLGFDLPRSHPGK